MPKISEKKMKRIEEQIIYYLYSIYPRSAYTADIASEIARDEEFIKKLLFSMKEKKIIIKIDKNSEGIKYERRMRWRISKKAYDICKEM